MTWFGKSEEDLKKWQEMLDEREKNLTERTRKIELDEADSINLMNILDEKSKRLNEKNIDLSVRELDISQKELNAKNNHINEQREAFKDVIENQLKWLDLRSDDLDKKQAEIENQLIQLKQLEGILAIKERTLKEAELNAENGFADKNKIALREVEKREEECHLLENRLKAREEVLVNKQRDMEKQVEQLRLRETYIKEAEIKRDEGYADEHKKLDEELSKKRNEYLKELSNKREQEFDELERIIAKEIQSRKFTLQNELLVLREQHDSFIQKEKLDLKVTKEKLVIDQAQQDELKEELEYQKQRLLSRKDVMDEREKSLNSEVDARIEERKHSFEHEKAVLKDEILRLRESIITSNALISNFEELKHKLGDEDPAAVLLRLKTYEEEIKILRGELTIRPTQEMQESFDRMKSRKEDLELACERLSEENESLRHSARVQSDLEMRIAELSDKNKSLKNRYDFIEADNNEMKDRLDKLKRSYERVQDREDRVKDIESPYFEKELPRAVDEVSELQWLDGIHNSCIAYGLKFPRRILHAFHTALKTSEWSPITVLAGVSGTGKSELPRLYSHFGGINFLSLSVQPNWDSKESMLGFFNSINNRFDAEPVLRLLAQSQKAKSEDYPFGLEDVMSLILMDEMNLAHVELYFAEFLSKLELRRGSKGNEVPALEVKLGAGIPSYDLRLGRNVLWAGTMNQDETTKSLSDKVLDRGIVINFPRPTTLERRELKPQGDHAPLLSRKLWESWWCKKSIFRDEHILPYKGFVEEMNSSLSEVGRALGHRVWQSIEYYMSNYPDVLEAHKNKDDALLIKAMKVAFEDQLVQKVMPKLRGIETRGKYKSDCLDKIRTQLVNDDYTIIDDFDRACKFGYGQFIWNSANYLKDDGEKNILETTENK